MRELKANVVIDCGTSKFDLYYKDPTTGDCVKLGGKELPNVYKAYELTKDGKKQEKKTLIAAEGGKYMDKTKPLTDLKDTLIKIKGEKKPCGIIDPKSLWDDVKKLIKAYNTKMSKFPKHKVELGDGKVFLVQTWANNLQFHSDKVVKFFESQGKGDAQKKQFKDAVRKVESHEEGQWNSDYIMNHLVTNDAARKLLKKYQFKRVLTFCSGSSKTHANKFDLYPWGKDLVKKGRFEKAKDWFYTADGEKKLNWWKVGPTAVASAGIAALTTGAAVGAFSPEEKGLSGMAKAGIAAAVAGVGAASWFGYKKYKRGQDDSEYDDEDRDVDLGGSKKGRKGRKNKKKKKNEKGSNNMLFLLGGLAVLAVVAFLFLGKAKKESSSYELEGEELV